MLHTEEEERVSQDEFALLTGAAINSHPSAAKTAAALRLWQHKSHLHFLPYFICSFWDALFRSLITHEIPFCPIHSHPARAPRSGPPVILGLKAKTAPPTSRAQGHPESSKFSSTEPFSQIPQSIQGPSGWMFLLEELSPSHIQLPHKNGHNLIKKGLCAGSRCTLSSPTFLCLFVCLNISLIL